MVLRRPETKRLQEKKTLLSTLQPARPIPPWIFASQVTGTSQRRTTSVAKLSIAMQHVLLASWDKSVVRLLQAPRLKVVYSLVVKSITIPVLTATFSNAGPVRLAKILLVSIGVMSNMCSGLVAHYVLKRQTQI